MKQSYVIGIIIFLLVFAAVVFFGFSGQKDTELVKPPVAEEPNDDRPAVTLTAKHQWKDGVHIVAGETEMPTPCHLLDWETIIAESYPEQVSINFSLMTQADMCAQVITPTRFKVEFEASEQASIRATLNGKEAVLNLIEVGPDENLDDFELFIKG